MVEWNRIFRLFLFSGILGQAREVHLKFRNEIPENVLSIRSSPGISGIFGRIEAPSDSGPVDPECGTHAISSQRLKCINGLKKGLSNVLYTLINSIMFLRRPLYIPHLSSFRAMIKWNPNVFFLLKQFTPVSSTKVASSQSRHFTTAHSG